MDVAFVDGLPSLGTSLQCILDHGYIEAFVRFLGLLSAVALFLRRATIMLRRGDPPLGDWRTSHKSFLLARPAFTICVLSDGIDPALRFLIHSDDRIEISHRSSLRFGVSFV